MPSLTHEVLVDLFRERPSLAPEILRICAGTDVGGGTSELGSIDLSQVAPTEYRADAVIKIRDERRVVVGAILIEIQLARDHDKRWTWPVYVAALRASLRCPVTLLVLTTLPDVAHWARAPITLGHPHFCLRPIAVSYDDIPWSIDDSSESVMLATFAHPDRADVGTVLDAISSLPEGRARLYSDLLLRAETLPDELRRRLERHMLNIDPEAFRAELEMLKRLEHIDGIARKIAVAKLGKLSIDEAATIVSIDGPSLDELILGLATATDEAGARAAMALAVQRCDEHRTRY